MKLIPTLPQIIKLHIFTSKKKKLHMFIKILLRQVKGEPQNGRICF